MNSTQSNLYNLLKYFGVNKLGVSKNTFYKLAHNTKIYIDNSLKDNEVRFENGMIYHLYEDECWNIVTYVEVIIKYSMGNEKCQILDN